MLTSSADPAIAARTAPAPTTTAPALELPLARRVLVDALLLGITGDALLEPSLTGLALPLWIALLGTTLAAATWSAGRVVTRQAAGWLALAVAFAGTLAWRDAGQLQAAGLLATLAALLMAAMSQRDVGTALFAPRLRDTAWAARNTLLGIVTGMLPLALREAIDHSSLPRHAERRGPMIRAVVMSAALLLVFGSLLRGADPVFASLLSLPDVKLDDVMPHVVLTGVFAWLAAGWTRAALDRRDAPAMPVPPRVTLGTLEITTSLGALNVLFAVYLCAQLGWFFGGERFLQARTGLTAAAYARTGFFEMVWVVILVVPVLLATRALLAPGRAMARRHSALAAPLVVLLGLMIISATSRLLLYVQYFGLTADRFYPMVFMGWLGLVLAWFAYTVLRGHGHRFVPGAIISAMLVLATLDVVAPDALIARVNIARATSTPTRSAPTLDLAHLASLSGEAAPLAVAMTVEHAADGDDQPCHAAHLLLQRWGPASRTAERYRDAGAWRRWNAGEAQALRIVGAHARELGVASRGGCEARRHAAVDSRAAAPAYQR